MIKVEVDPLYLGALYQKAREGYFSCINGEEKESLQEELGMPLDSLIVTEGNIKLVLTPKLSGYYTIEARLDLSFVDDDAIGYYDYVEDMEGEFIDEFLVFPFNR